MYFIEHVQTPIYYTHYCHIKTVCQPSQLRTLILLRLKKYHPRKAMKHTLSLRHLVCHQILSNSDNHLASPKYASLCLGKYKKIRTQNEMKCFV